MRWYLKILPCLLILLTLGAELCTTPGVALVKGPSHLVCLLDDDDAESELQDGLQRQDSWLDLDSLNLTGLFTMTRSAKTVVVLSLEETEVLELTSGVRRHRWLCRECC
ncbi:MAG: hypothetical protein JWR15_4039 [Prosthecobacter sp.]|nr:hypothetical protein [Prosthecobacter sp.]